MKQFRRTPYRESSQGSHSLLSRARQLLFEGRFFEGVDLFEQVVDADPRNATVHLAELYRIYLERQKSASRYDLYQGRHYAFSFSPGEKVLDVGSGHLPFPFATHLSDISTSDHTIGRAGSPFKEVNGKPSYEINVEAMPFKDKEFDFIYCSHVLEHTVDPERACRELMRVGKRGYIETPTRGKDLFLNTARISNHNWAVEKVNGRLIFSQYTEEEKDGLISNLLMDMHLAPQTAREEAFSALIVLKSDKMNTMLMWDGSFEFEVRKCTTEKPLPSTAGSAGTRSNEEPIEVRSPCSQNARTPFVQKLGRSPRCVFLDTYYHSFLESLYRDEPSLGSRGYQAHLAAILSKGFGDSDFYSKGLSDSGWETFHIICNSLPLQQQWAQEHHSSATGDSLILEQLTRLAPDVVYCQDIHTTSRALLLEMKRRGWLVVGQNASSLNNEPIECYDILFSSLPDQVALFRSLGVASYYQPLSFEPRLLSRLSLEEYRYRSLDVSFVGSFASPKHKDRTKLLEEVSRAVPLSVWGTGKEFLAPDSPFTPVIKERLGALQCTECLGRVELLSTNTGRFGRKILRRELRMMHARL